VSANEDLQCWTLAVWNPPQQADRGPVIIIKKKRCTIESQVPSAVMTELGTEFFSGQQVGGSFYGFLFSVAWQMEGGGETQGGVVKRQAMQRGPEVEDVALSSAVGLEALEDVLAEVDGEGVLAIGGVPMDRTGTAALLAAAVQLRERAGKSAEKVSEGAEKVSEGPKRFQRVGSRLSLGVRGDFAYPRRIAAGPWTDFRGGIEMLELQGRSVRFGDGISRRGFLKIGSLGLAGLSLPNVLRALESEPAQRRRPRAVILYWMAGGPSHVDTYDMKPNAPAQVRGPFRPAPTRVPGMQFCELLPRQARIADKISLVRSLTHQSFEHFDASHWVQTGVYERGVMGRGQPWPSQGSVVSMLRGSNQAGMPPYVCIPEAYSSLRGFYQRAGFLGAAYNPLSSGGAALSERYHINRPELVLGSGLTPGRLEDRRVLQNQIGEAARALDAGGAAASMDRYYQRAFELITSPRVQTAFDLGREPAHVQDRYGRHAWGQAALLARRLVEAGVTFVTINHFEAEIDWWDDHYTLEANLRRRLPIYDQAVASLIEDLHERGLGDQVLVAAFGEFGRSPVMDAQGGRGHWARAWHALLSGGGVQGGRIVGSTTSNGHEPRDRAVGPGDLLATVYRSLGIDPATTMNDRQDRPVRLVQEGSPIHELF
jgi:hypothetical protein